MQLSDLAVTNEIKESWVPSMEELGDLGPLVAVALVCLEDHLLFFAGNGILVDLGVQVIVPSVVLSSLINTARGTACQCARLSGSPLSISER